MNRAIYKCSNRPKPRWDLTRRGLSRQLRALGARQFEFGLKDETNQRMERRCWTLSEALDRVSWLKHRNATGHHIYVRPGVAEAVILIDDLNLSALRRMDEDDVCSLCVVETSPLNFQSWVRVSNDSLEPELATCLGELLAKRYDGDCGSKDFRHLGRAVGFTNVKPEHVQKNGYYPYSRLVERIGKITPGADTLIEEAVVLLKKKKAERSQIRGLLAERSASRSGQDATAFFQEAVSVVYAKYGINTDGSRADAAAVRRMIHAGFSRDDIELAMLSDNNIHARRKGHVEDYVRRTTNWAFGLSQ